MCRLREITQTLNLRERLKSKKFRTKCLIILGAFILIFAAIFTLFINPLLNRDKYIYKEAVVEKGDLVLGIQESGTLDLHVRDINYDIVIDTDEDEEDDDDEEDEEDETKYLTVEEVYCAPGQRVKKGDKLFKMTADSVAAVRRQLQSLQTEAEITLEEAQAEYNISVLAAKSTYESSLVDSRYADSSYNAGISAVSNEIKKLSEDIVVLQGEIEDLNEDLADEDLWTSYKEAKTAYTSAANKLKDTSVHNPYGYTSNYTTYTQAKETFDQLQGQIDEMNESIVSKQEEIQKKQQELSQKQSVSQSSYTQKKQDKDTSALSGETAEDIYGYTTNSLEESVSSAKNSLSEAQSNLDDFNTFIGEDDMVYAPEDGIITAVNYTVDDEIISTGALASYSTGTEDTLSVDVAEEDVPYINVGDSVEVFFTAYPDVSYMGFISGIETTKTDNYETTVNYPVSILIQGDTSLLYGGMVGDVTFAKETVQDVLYVSRKAIVEKDDKTTYVYQKNSLGKMILTPVETGFSNGSSIEIKNGLSEKDTIYIASKVSAENAGTLEEK